MYINCNIEKLIFEKKNGQKIALYGAGKGGKLIFQLLKLCGVKPDLFIDNDAEKSNRVVCEDVRAYLPQMISDKEHYIVINCVDWFTYEIIEELIKADGFIHIFKIQNLIDDILLHDIDLLKKILVLLFDNPEMDVMYTTNHAITKVNNRNADNIENERIAIYTSVFGDYDSLCLPRVFPENIDYYYISEKRVLENSKVHWINADSVLPKWVNSDIKKNRYLKMHPHIVFPEYKYSVYVDGNIEIVGDVSNCFKKSKTGISLYEHFNRDCLYYEGLQVVNFKRVCVDDVYNQLCRYLQEGMPLHYGLTEMALIAREHNNPVCREIMELWWKEFNRGAQRDQLSFMYSLWKLGYNYDDISILGKDFRKSPYLRYFNHKNNSKMIKNEK